VPQTNLGFFSKHVAKKEKLKTRLFNKNYVELRLWCKRGILFFLAVYILHLPFPGYNATIKSVALGGVAVLWIARLVLEGDAVFLRTKLWWPFITFTLIGVISIVGSIDILYSLDYTKKYTAKSLFLFFAIVNNIREIKDIKILLLILMVSTGLFSALGLIHFAWSEPSVAERLRFIYLDANVNRFSKFYDLVIPLNMALILATNDKIKKALFGIIFLLSISVSVLMQTRGSYVAIFLSLVAISFVYRKKFLIYISALLITACFIMPQPMIDRAKEMVDFKNYFGSDAVLSPRSANWELALKTIKEYPLLGVGIGKGNFKTAVDRLDPPFIPYDHSHNTLLQITVETGLIGLAAFLWLFSSVFFHGFKHFFSLYKKSEEATVILGILCGIGGLFLHGLVTHFYKQEAFYTLWIMVAILFALIEGNKNVVVRTSDKPT